MTLPNPPLGFPPTEGAPRQNLSVWDQRGEEKEANGAKLRKDCISRREPSDEAKRSRDFQHWQLAFTHTNISDRANIKTLFLSEKNLKGKKKRNHTINPIIAQCDCVTVSLCDCHQTTNADAHMCTRTHAHIRLSLLSVWYWSQGDASEVWRAWWDHRELWPLSTNYSTI